MSPPIIVIAGKDPTAGLGGMESYLRAYGRAAIKAGYEPHFFCVNDRSGVEETAFGVVHRARSPFRPFRGLMLAAHQPFILRQVERFARREDGPYLVHSFGPWPGVGLAAVRRLRRHGVDAVPVATSFSTYLHETLAKVEGVAKGYPLAVRASIWSELLWTRLAVNPSEHRGLRGSRVVFVNYRSVRSIIEKQCGSGIRFASMTYSAETAFVREGAPRADRPAPIDGLSPGDAPLVVSVSRHDARKGNDVLLHGLAELRRQAVPFRACLVGGGALLQLHRQLARQLGLDGCTAVVGWAEDSYAYLEHADIYVLASRQEGSGSVALLEAMQAGVAPVLSRIDGIPEDVEDGENALLVEPGDPAALAAALARLLTDGGLRRRLGAGARRRFETRFSGEAFAADLRHHYTALGFPPG